MNQEVKTKVCNRCEENKSVDVADSIAKTSQTLVNCVRTELLIKNSNNK